ncbi:MAG: hypothetical protein ABI597_00845 [Gammaproteobacteria bacterium]
MDLKKQEVTLNIKRRSLILKYHFSEVIKEIWLIESLSIKDAALLGYFYGRCYRILQKNNAKNLNSSPFLFKKNKGVYKVLCQQRDGNIVFTDRRSQETFVEHPDSILRNSHVLNNFDALQAFYIGMLVGLAFKKENTENFKPCLKVVN